VAQHLDDAGSALILLRSEIADLAQTNPGTISAAYTTWSLPTCGSTRRTSGLSGPKPTRYSNR